MTHWKAALPALLISTSAFLAGCFDAGQEPKPEDPNTLSTSAFTGSPVFVCAACGHVPAFFGYGVPSRPEGYALDMNRPVRGGYELRHLYFNTALQRNEIETISNQGGFVDIDVENGKVYGLDSDGRIFRGVQQTPGGAHNWSWLWNLFSAYRVGVGKYGEVYALGVPVVAGGYSLYKWGGGINEDTWKRLSPAGLKDIDVDNNGDLWGVNTWGEVFYLKAGDPITSIVYKGYFDALKIACGNNKVYLRNGSGKIMQLVNGTFTTVTAAGYNDIHVDYTGRIWASAINGNINSWSGI